MNEPVTPNSGIPGDSLTAQPEIPTPDVVYTQPAQAPMQPTDVPDQPFVVPAATASNVNPFIPQVTPEANSGYTQTTVAAHSGGGLRRVFMLIVILLAVAGAIFFGSKYFTGNPLQGNNTAALTYWGLWEDDSTIRSVLADFEATHPGVTVTYSKQNPKQYRERLQAFIEKGEGPDVFRFHNTWVPMLRNELYPAPATIMTASEFSTAFYPVASADLVGGESVYGIPMMIDGLGLYYNEDLFAAAGVAPPVTWEDVLNIVPKLTVKRDNTIITSAIALGTTGNVQHFSDIFATMMMQNGAKPSNPSGQQAEEAITFYKKFATPSDPVYTWNETMDDSIFAFASGKVAMILAPSWRVFDIKQISPSLRFKVLPIPQLPGNTVTWASYWVEGVSSKSKNPGAAWELVKYMTSSEVTVKFYTEVSKTRLFGEPYARVDLGSTISEDPYAGAFIKQASTAKSFPLSSRTFDNGLNDKLIKYIEDAINSMSQGTSAQGALETAAQGFRQVLGSYGLTTGSASTTAQ